MSDIVNGFLLTSTNTGDRATEETENALCWTALGADSAGTSGICIFLQQCITSSQLFQGTTLSR